MATAEQFREAAAELRRARLSAQDAESVGWAVADSHGLAGGPIADVVGQAVMAARVKAQSLQDELEAAAKECERRAEICDDYAAAMARYTQQRAAWWEDFAAYDSYLAGGPPASEPGRSPLRPEPPFTWVELP